MASLDRHPHPLNPVQHTHTLLVISWRLWKPEKKTGSDRPMVPVKDVWKQFTLKLILRL